jgi:16S rRNA (cytosine1402-N4)-methyltransferase
MIDAPNGETARHLPVMPSEAVAALNVRPGAVVVDGTFGAGGYSRLLLAAGARVIAIDRDPDAIAAGQTLQRAYENELRLVRGRFSALDRLADEKLDGVILDIGVSSMQFDQGERGFSFRTDAPLDMRMEQTGKSAADLLAEAAEEHLADIFYHFGEERGARRIAKAIVERRAADPIATTKQLADLMSALQPQRPGEFVHPATRVFQALRIAVNAELSELLAALAAAERALKPGGRLAVVTFHSLEDRIVKQFLATRATRGKAVSRRLPGEAAPEAPTFIAFPGQPVGPSVEEVRVNPRARSAKLRFAERLGAPARPLDAALRRLAAPTSLLES